MKKLLALLLCIAMSATLLAGCNSTTKTTDDNSDASNLTDITSDKIEVDKNLLSVEIILPASMYEGVTAAEIEAKNTDDYKATLNDDDSVTLKMSRAKHNELMADYKKQLTDEFQEMLNGNYPSLKSITPNDDFSKVTIFVDKAKFESSFTDGFVVMGVGINASMYQTFNAVPQDKIKVVITVQDEATKEVISTTTYPEVLKDKRRQKSG